MTTSLNLPGDWRFHGICRDEPEAWFPGSNDEAGIAAAKKDCATCPVIAQCREWALDTKEPHGVWGGMSERDRAAKLAPPKRTRKGNDTLCLKGHEYTIENTRVNDQGYRTCLICERVRNKRKQERNAKRQAGAA